MKINFEKPENRKKLLKAFLVSATIEDDLTLSVSRRFVLSELINGTIEYMHGKAGKIIFQNFYGEDLGVFEKEIETYFKEQVLGANGNITIEIKKAIENLTRAKVHPGPGDSYVHCELYEFFRGTNHGIGSGICPMTPSRTFRLNSKLVEEVQKEIIPNLPDKERENVIGIGDSMKKYIRKDLELIRSY